ncbi:MAG: hypothetical protein IJ753_09380 [Bacteroidales bacterium]|nr:hypothetical protein [Bacteroidales bacterium]MBR1783709.1 hypothetical protein [Bacteroidales bacterium]
MKKLFASTLLLVLFAQAQAQNVVDHFLNRFADPDRPRTAFLEKGGRGIGFSGAYRQFNVAGDNLGDGYAILSMLNIGEGRLHLWSVAPRVTWFVADDVSLGFSLVYSGYSVDTNLKIDAREMLGADPTDPDSESLNFQISNRHMANHKGGININARRYLSFFGSKTFGVFAEGRLFGNYGVTTSNPIAEAGTQVTKLRVSNTFNLGLDIAGGLAVRFGNNIFTASIPLVGVAWTHSHQNRYWTVEDENGSKATGGGAKLNQFKIARNIELLGLQVGYIRYIGPKNKK